MRQFLSDSIAYFSLIKQASADDKEIGENDTVMKTIAILDYLVKQTGFVSNHH